MPIPQKNVKFSSSLKRSECILPRKTNRPTLDEYHGMEAEAYGSSNWMARNQIRTTKRALELLESDNIGGNLIIPFPHLQILDLGAGTGYSSQTIHETQARVIGIDISRDMLRQGPELLHLSYIQADMRHIPLRNHTCDHMISISAFNFAAEGAKSENQMKEQIHSLYRDITRVLRDSARIALEFYPTALQEKIFISVLHQFPFAGGMIIDNPKTRKEKKYLILSRT